MKNKARLVNLTKTSQAIEVNRKFFCLPGGGNMTIEEDDVVYFNKYAITIEEIKC